MPRNILVFLIKVYQRTLSPDHGVIKVLFPGGYCRFTPSCSTYSIEAVKKYGVIYGGAKSIFRVIRCNPFSRGGVDPVDKI
ncbi:membrane protein insertion efficiency factor YidD [Candidatus Peregrinibacteria bacterium]|nr:membrane protein insertion efficiency factor YidD [Candidatus Peregrinibacteria bacterium]